MMIAVARGEDGHRVILLGVVRGNIDRLTAGKPIRASAESHPGFPRDVTVGIIFAETEAELSALIQPYMAGDAKITVMPAPVPVPLGATGQFPYGQADAHDEGELTMALAADHAVGIVRIVFGKPIGWLGLPSGEARQLAAMLVEKADELDRRKA
jgi:hypothetical protein